MKSKTVIWRMVVEILVLIMTFSAVDMLTWPSESTAAAVTDAVSKKQLEPICMIEVRSAIHSASFMHLALSVIGIAVILLLCFDAFALSQSRRKI
jgi:hypothetical protein